MQRGRLYLRSIFDLMRTGGSFLMAIMVLVGCEFTYKVTTGKQAYDVKQFAVAVELFQQEYRQTSNPLQRSQQAYLLGKSYERLNDPASAATWFKQAYDDGFGQDALADCARNLQQTERYEEAMQIYRELMAQGSSTLAYRAEIVKCQQAMQWKQEEAEYVVSKTGFNTPASEYAPHVLAPQTILITSDRLSDETSTYQWTGRGFSDIYVVNTSSNMIQPYDRTINTEHNEGTVALSRDQREIYFSRCYGEKGYDMFCKLMVSFRMGSTWSEPEVLPFVQEGVNYGHPALSADDSLMFFSCNDPNGFGGYDLYFSRRTAEGWADPVILPDYVNTTDNEKFPSLYRDTLFFSSDGHVGMGGLDIYKTFFSAQGRWTAPLNLKPPINSGWDDFGLTVDTFARSAVPVLEQGFFCSSREAGMGSDDIYHFEKRLVVEDEPADEVVAEGPEEPDIKYQLFLAVRVMEPIFSDPLDPNSERVGKRPLDNARLTIGEGMVAKPFRTNSDGFLIMEVDYEARLFLQARFRGFLTKSANFDARTIEKDPQEPVKTHNLEIVLDPIFRDQEIILDNIYYDLDESFIREDAKPALNELVKILADNPGIRIELGSHTDCRADDDYNFDLSQRRAQAAVDYIVGKGIDVNKLQARGYGETAFAVNCECSDCTEEEHQANRRTTFKIVQ